jgi:hypothetical protein
VWLQFHLIWSKNLNKINAHAVITCVGFFAMQRACAWKPVETNKLAKGVLKEMLEANG